MSVHEDVTDPQLAMMYEAQSVDQIDHHHPLSLKIVLHGKNKLGFVLGTCKKSNYDVSLHELWDRFNVIVLAWIMNTVSPNLLSTVIYASDAYTVWEDLRERFDKVNISRAAYLHKEIATLTQGVSSISVYFSRLRELWDEYETLTPPPTCGCPESKKHVEHYQLQKLYQFLTGLNDSYKNAKNQVLMTRPLPNLNQVYAMIINVESQRINGKGVYGSNDANEVAAMMSNRHYNNNGGPTNTAYTAGYKTKKSFNKSPVYCEYCSQSSEAQNNSLGSSTLSSLAKFFTPEQYQQILQMLNKGKDAEPVANSATTGTAELSETDKNKVYLPTGEKLIITHTGICSFSEIRSGKVLGIGKEELGLYILKTKDRQFSEQHLPPTGPYRIPTHDNKRFFLSLVDDYSKYIWIFLLTTKVDTIVALKNFLAMVRNQFRTSIKCLRTDNGTEFMNDQVTFLFQNLGILHQSSCVYTPQQNRVIEKRHRSILDMARALRFQAYVPLCFWGECVSTAVYLLNRLPTILLQGKTLFEALYQKGPSIQHLRVFGSLYYATKVQKVDKFIPRVVPTIFMGYSYSQKGYVLYDLHSKGFFVSRDVVFKEYIFPFKNMRSDVPCLFLILEFRDSSPIYKNAQQPSSG
nr:uncharacterized protein LOC104093413 [Nicotiana tomentosiformis]